MKGCLALVVWGVVIAGATVWSYVGAFNGITGGWGTDPIRFLFGIAYLVLAAIYTLMIGALVVIVSSRPR